MLCVMSLVYLVHTSAQCSFVPFVLCLIHRSLHGSNDTRKEKNAQVDGFWKKQTEDMTAKIIAQYEAELKKVTSRIT